MDEPLTKAGEDMELRVQQRNSTPKDCRYEYDRAQAAAYSSQWAGRRNEEWDDFYAYTSGNHGDDADAPGGGNFPSAIQAGGP